MGEFSHFALQAALHECLSGDATLGALLNGVFDFVPAKTAYPYMTIGDMSSSDVSAVEAVLTQIDVVLHVYSRGRGRKEAGDIMQRILQILPDNLAELEDFRLVSMRHIGSDVRLESDGLSYHARMRWRAVVQQDEGEA